MPQTMSLVCLLNRQPIGSLQCPLNYLNTLHLLSQFWELKELQQVILSKETALDGLFPIAKMLFQVGCPNWIWETSVGLRKVLKRRWLVQHGRLGRPR